MTLPFFYIRGFNSNQKDWKLDEDTSRHVVQVLRMKQGDMINLTDGKGKLITAVISEPHKKHCLVNIQHSVSNYPPSRKVTIAISLLKNSNRFEWFLEKATELGVSEIIPLACERTEKEKFRKNRMEAICISAMLQSQQTWLPVLHEPVKFSELLRSSVPGHSKFIAHCGPGQKTLLSEKTKTISDQAIMLIGPEGDFSNTEIESAFQNGYLPVSLGGNRLRTETAGVVAAALLSYP